MYPGISQNNYKKSDYIHTHLWFSYVFYKLNILSYESYLSLIGGIYGVDTNIEFDDNLFVNNAYNINNYKITSDKNGFISIGPSLKILLSKNHIFNVNLILLTGNFKWSLIINENTFFSPNNQGKNFISIEVNTTGSSNGFLLEGEYNYIFYKNWYVFIKYQWNENRYKMKSTGKVIEPDRREGSPPPLLSSGLMSLVTFREKKIAIEKTQVIYFGVGYSFNFL
ncbi:MAG: hypothetical protein KatS3mg129_2990 [Leptospiraceae bacterium]|nr:MAG: hypothetical protein KatS3mg129_2990 [Leptospiraceae bacterium]